MRFHKYEWIGRKLTAALLAGALAVSCAACGKGETDGSDAGKAYVYVPTFTELKTERGNFYDAAVSNGKLYYMINEWDEETYQSSVSVGSCSVLDGSQGEPVKLEMKQTGEENINRNIERILVGTEGVIRTVETIWEWDETTGESDSSWFLCVYDAQGKLQSEADISAAMGDENYVQYAETDPDGRVALATNGAILLLDADGSALGKIELGNDNGWVQGMCTDSDGNVYVNYSEYTSNANIRRLYRIDFDARAFGDTYEDFPNTSGIRAGEKGKLLLNDGSKLYEYDFQSRQKEELFSWMDCDINGGNVNQFGMLEDGRVFALIEDYENQSTELALLTRTKASDVQQKTVLTLGCLYEDDNIKAAAIKFNKTNDQYRITMKSYYDYSDVTGDNYQDVMNDAVSRLNNDITSKNNCPDLLILDSVNTPQLAAKGVFEDIGKYLDESPALSRDRYMESVLNGFSYDGVLVGIPKNFYVQTIAGKTSQVGQKEGWTLEDLMAYSQAHSGAEIFDGYTKEAVMQTLISYNQDSFINWETGECSFESDAFQRVLEFVGAFPDEYEYDSDYSTPSKLADGAVLLYPATIYSFESIQEAAGMFGEPVTFIGYPNDSGSFGSYLVANGAVAMTTKCRDKEGAWKFLEYYLTQEESSWYRFGFSADKEIFEKEAAEAAEIQYVLDENGNPYLDENGEPIVEGGGSSVAYEDGFTYEYHHTTQEEVDTLLRLVENAGVSSEADGQVIRIIMEEAAGYFAGQKSVDEVCGAIQSRVKLYVSENR